MTKLRPPVSCELALTRIAGLVGWERVAVICDQAPRTVRRWSDPDESPAAGDALSLERATCLDAAYRAEGGDGAPLLQCSALRLEAALAASMVDQAAIAASAARSAKEHGEALAATFAAARPDAGQRELAAAERELEESIAASTDTLTKLRAVRAAREEKP